MGLETWDTALHGVGMCICVAWWLQLLKHDESTREGVWLQMKLLISVHSEEISIECSIPKFADLQSAWLLRDPVTSSRRREFSCRRIETLECSTSHYRMPPGRNNVRTPLLMLIQTYGHSTATAAESPFADPSVLPSTSPTVDTFSCSSAGALASSTGCSGVLAFSSSFTALFLLGLRGRCCFLGGVFTSNFSWVLLVELAVGRIIRARKPWSAAFGAPILVRAFGFSDALDGAGREGRDVFLP